MSDIGYPRAHRKPDSAVNIYDLPVPDPSFWDRIMEKIEQHGGERFPAIADVGARLITEGLQTDASSGEYWGERHIYVEPDSDRPPLTRDEVLALLERLVTYVEGSLKPGVYVANSAWHAFQGLLGRGELRRRDYGPALEALIAAEVVIPAPDAAQETARPGIRWPLAVTETTVQECHRARFRAEHPWLASAEAWLQRQHVLTPNLSRAVFFIFGTLFGAVVTAML